MQFIHGIKFINLSDYKINIRDVMQQRKGVSIKKSKKRTLVEPLRAHPMTHIRHGHSNKRLRPRVKIESEA